jgi:broad specificity phosphatase PhoE
MINQHLREPLNGCTCAWRHPKSWIHERFPAFRFGPEVTETDELWMEDMAETSAAHKARLQGLLEDIFSEDQNVFISMTSHAGTIRPLLSVVRHPNPDFNLKTGQVVPVLVRGERIQTREPYTAPGPPTKIQRCLPCGPEA